MFGPEHYLVLIGRLALPLMIAMVVSPFIGGLAFQRGSAFWTLRLLTALALTNVLLIGTILVQRGKNRKPPYGAETHHA
jgi:hypothetical protein